MGCRSVAENKKSPLPLLVDKLNIPGSQKSNIPTIGRDFSL